MATTEMQANIQDRREIRKENRITAALPLMVDFADSFGPQPVCTYDVSQNGARLARPWSDVEVDQTFWLIRNLRRSLHRVVWIGDTGSPRSGQIGVERVQDGKCVWDDHLQEVLEVLDMASDMVPALAVDAGAMMELARREIVTPKAGKGRRKTQGH